MTIGLAAATPEDIRVFVASENRPREANVIIIIFTNVGSRKGLASTGQQSIKKNNNKIRDLYRLMNFGLEPWRSGVAPL